MPRDRSLRSEVVANGFVASASRRSPKKTVGHSHKVKSGKWQEQAWFYFDTIGEYRSACSWIGNLISKATLYVVGPDGKPATEGPAFDALDALYGGPEGHAEMLRLFGTHLTVGGDCYLVGESRGAGEDDDWQVVANTKMKAVTTNDGQGWYRIEDSDGTSNEPLADDAFVMRLWRGHPLDRKQGDSNSRAALPILTELMTLRKRIAADSDSRLTGNGILLIPNEVTFPSMQQAVDTDVGEGEVEAKATREGLDGFMDLIIDVASLSMADQDSAVAKVPIVLQMPGDAIAKVKHITFWSGFDAQTKELRSESVQSLALAMDMPPEVLTGTAGMNHWGSWQVGEDAIKTYAEPLLELITSSVSKGYLWEVLIDGGMSEDEARGWVIGADLTEAKLRPNRSKEAIEMHDRGAMSAAAMLRENGFTEDDAMTEEERTLWLTQKVASGATTPELVAIALRILGVAVPEVQDERPPAEERPTPSLEEHPVRELPKQQEAPAEAASAQLLAAAEPMLFRALERAGNKLKSKGIKPEGVAAADIYRYATITAAQAEDLLDDAWSCADRFTVKVPTAALHAYARGLLVSQNEHKPAMLQRFLELHQAKTGKAA